jgi:hypothetical protein
MRADRTSLKRLGVACVPATVYLVAAFAVQPLLGQESTSFRHERLTLASSAGPLSSASYVTTITFAQEGPVGSVSRCNNGFFQSTGFWSVLGETPVPVWLIVDKNGVDPTQVDLAWSGSSSLFTLYRGVVAESLIDPLNILLTTPDCSVTDAPPASAITFYLVRPTGP